MKPNLFLPPGHALKLLQKVQSHESAVELVYMSHERWPFSLLPTHPQPKPDTIRVSVLDSSFNPPTSAHLALANSLPPPTRYTMRSGLPGSAPASAAELDYDARLLLLSVRNADKALKPGDATYEQRLEMMYLLSKDISASHAQLPEGRSESGYANVAIAIIDEPTFIGKAAVLRHFLRARITDLYTLDRRAIAPTSPEISIPNARLVFLIGFDTLVRLLSPRYYASEAAMMDALRFFFSPGGGDCCVVCAQRTSAGVERTVQEELKAKTLSAAREFMMKKRVALIDIGADEISSSEVRTKVATKDETWKRLVTAPVADYIIQSKLYASETTIHS
ncbi:Nucleotidylyl transferase [Rhizopogon vinicolor AM-OR11-026]|uniref:Nucleotidylyl transferase n=1 Tax=Rhizopogon vinicolor AM-OR11-026 TaxID=1314800 RepID=A0A1B7NCT6_9AGAM|nr:Nucleotidylyl transferase [Rhizopogon vinicolor AM-OR11-026]